MTLIPLDIAADKGTRVSVTGEQASTNFAVAPMLTKLDDDTYGLDTRQTLIHVPTGHAMPGTLGACLDLRALAARLETVLDWSVTDPARIKLTDEQKAAYLAALDEQPVDAVAAVVQVVAP